MHSPVLRRIRLHFMLPCFGFFCSSVLSASKLVSYKFYIYTVVMYIFQMHMRNNCLLSCGYTFIKWLERVTNDIRYAYNSITTCPNPFIKNKRPHHKQDSHYLWFKLFLICFVFRCIIEIGYKRQNNDPALWQTGWFQFLHRQRHRNLFDMQERARHTISF
jgi:hypothetical protein